MTPSSPQPGSQSGAPPAAAASPGNLLEMHILRSHLRPAATSETLGAGPSMSHGASSPLGKSDVHS